jgi:hypothetical protein
MFYLFCTILKLHVKENYSNTALFIEVPLLANVSHDMCQQTESVGRCSVPQISAGALQISANLYGIPAGVLGTLETLPFLCGVLGMLSIICAAIALSLKAKEYTTHLS